MQETELLEMLESAGIITNEQSTQVLAIIGQPWVTKNIDEVLIEIGAISKNQREELVELIYGLPSIDLSKYVCDLEAARYVPLEMAEEHSIIPLFADENEVTIATGNPNKDDILGKISERVGFPIRLIYADKKEIEKNIPRYYKAANSVDQAVQKVSADTMAMVNVGPDFTDGESAINILQQALEETGVLDQLAKDASVIALVHAILLLGVKNGASVLHIEPRKNDIEVILRVGGRLQQSLQLPKNVLPALLVRLKSLANIDLSSVDKPVSGKLVVAVRHEKLKLHLHIIPTIFGEKAVITGFQPEASTLPLYSLGLQENELASMLKLLDAPSGLVIFTGSEKARRVSLYASALALNSVDNQLIIFEEKPGRFDIKEGTLVEVTEEMGGFGAVIKYCRDLDHNVMVVGNLGDKEGASQAMQAAIRKNIVLAAFDAGGAIEAMVKLRTMGVDANLIALSLSGVIAQHWVATLCPECKVQNDPAVYENPAVRGIFGPEYFPAPAEGNGKGWFGKADEAGANAPLKTPISYASKGCERCKGKGYASAMLLTEIFPVTPRIQRAILEGSEPEVFEQLAASAGLELFKQKVVRLIEAGTLDLREAMRVIPGSKQ